MAAISPRSSIFQTVSEISTLEKDDIEWLATQDNTALVGKHIKEMYTAFIGEPTAQKTQDTSRKFFSRQKPQDLKAFRKGLRRVLKLASEKQMPSIKPIIDFIIVMTKPKPVEAPISPAQGGGVAVSVVGQSAGGSSRLGGPVQEEPVRWIKLEDGRVIKETDLAKQLGIPVDHPIILMRRAMAETTPVTSHANGTVEELDGKVHQTQDRL